jgi:MoaA/NifB/PqqE/SkfB family radical SAM enzyme
MLNWFYERSLEGGIELKATCAPHYFRVVRQRRVAERHSETAGAQAAHRVVEVAPPAAASIGPTEMAMPGSTGIELKPHGIGQAVGHPGTHPSDMNAMTKGCLAGTAVCFISHQGEVYPCGYLPALAGDLKRQSFADIWENSVVFNQLRKKGGDARAVIMITADPQLDDVKAALKLGAYDFVGKPVDFDELHVHYQKRARGHEPARRSPE